MKTKIIYNEKDKKTLKDKFNISMKDEIDKLTTEITEKEEEKKKQKNPQILENVPDEFKKGNKKILLG